MAHYFRCSDVDSCFLWKDRPTHHDTHSIWIISHSSISWIRYRMSRPYMVTILFISFTSFQFTHFNSAFKSLQAKTNFPQKNLEIVTDYTLYKRHDKHILKSFNTRIFNRVHEWKKHAIYMLCWIHIFFTELLNILFNYCAISLLKIPFFFCFVVFL